MDVGESPSVVKFVGFNSSKFGPKFVNYKSIIFVSVIVIENDWMTKMHSMR